MQKREDNTSLVEQMTFVSYKDGRPKYDFVWLYCPDCGAEKLSENTPCYRCGSMIDGTIL